MTAHSVPSCAFFSDKKKKKSYLFFYIVYLYFASDDMLSLWWLRNVYRGQKNGSICNITNAKKRLFSLVRASAKHKRGL